MSKYCCVKDCFAVTNKCRRRAFGFPHHSDARYPQWLAFVRADKGPDWMSNENSRICQFHFEPNSFSGKSKLSKNAVPIYKFVDVPPPQPPRQQRRKRSAIPTAKEKKFKKIVLSTGEIIEVEDVMATKVAAEAVKNVESTARKHDTQTSLTTATNNSTSSETIVNSQKFLPRILGKRSKPTVKTEVIKVTDEMPQLVSVTLANNEAITIDNHPSNTTNSSAITETVLSPNNSAQQYQDMLSKKSSDESGTSDIKSHSNSETSSNITNNSNIDPCTNTSIIVKDGSNVSCSNKNLHENYSKAGTSILNKNFNSGNCNSIIKNKSKNAISILNKNSNLGSSKSIKNKSKNDTSTIKKKSKRKRSKEIISIVSTPATSVIVDKISCSNNTTKYNSKADTSMNNNSNTTSSNDIVSVNHDSITPEVNTCTDMIDEQDECTETEANTSNLCKFYNPDNQPIKHVTRQCPCHLQIRRLQFLLRLETRKRKNVEMNIKKFLNDDQVRFLQRKSSRYNPHPWSEKTLKECEDLKVIAGDFGYQHLTKKGWPLPSIRSVQRNIKLSQDDPTQRVKKPEPIKLPDKNAPKVVKKRSINKDGRERKRRTVKKKVKKQKEDGFALRLAAISDMESEPEVNAAVASMPIVEERQQDGIITYDNIIIEICQDDFGEPADPGVQIDYVQIGTISTQE